MKCGKCGAKDIDFNFTKGKISCKFCGYLIDENISNPEINFEAKKYGQKEIRGQIIQKPSLFPIEKTPSPTLLKFGVRRKMTQLGNQLRINNEHIESAFQLFLFSLQNKLKSGKSLHSLSISCLYAICRKEKTPHLLIDFSDISQTRSSKIGVEFLRFLKITRIPLPVIDPSVYIHRFVSKLNLGEKTNSITLSSLRLIARMKRNWMSTGRKPTGLCGAAIILAARIHGMKRTQKEVCKVVRIGIQALRCRLFEVDKTSIKKLNINQLDKGGGDDGNRESLLELNLEDDMTIFIKKEKENTISNSNKNQFLKYDSKIYKDLIEKNKKLKFSGEKKLPSNLAKDKIRIFSQLMIYYINSEFETIIKEQIWEKMNADFANFQAIRSRIQKEKPYAFFGNKKIHFNPASKTTKVFR
jgi:transcription factor IIIB subunit 2